MVSLGPYGSPCGLFWGLFGFFGAFLGLCCALVGSVGLYRVLMGSECLKVPRGAPEGLGEPQRA